MHLSPSSETGQLLRRVVADHSTHEHMADHSLCCRRGGACETDHPATLQASGGGHCRQHQASGQFHVEQCCCTTIYSFPLLMAFLDK